MAWEDMVNVRFMELMPPHRTVETINLATTDLAFLGEMTIVVTFEEVSSRSSHRLDPPGVPGAHDRVW